MTAVEQAYWGGVKRACDDVGADFTKLAQFLNAGSPAATAVATDVPPAPRKPYAGKGVDYSGMLNAPKATSLVSVDVAPATKG